MFHFKVPIKFNQILNPAICFVNCFVSEVTLNKCFSRILNFDLSLKCNSLQY